MKGWLTDLLLFGGTRRRYKKDNELRQAIVEDAELAPKSKKLGVKSIVFSVISMLIVGLGALGIYLLFKLDESALFFAIIGSILIIAVIVIVFIELYVRALRLLVYQFKLNKHPIRWVGLVCILIPSVLFVVAVVLLVMSLV